MEEAEYAAFRPFSVALDAVSVLTEHKRIGMVARAVKMDSISTVLPVLKLMDRAELSQFKLTQPARHGTQMSVNAPRAASAARDR
eukprot:5757016-Prymnesium_polylepis.1